MPHPKLTGRISNLLLIIGSSVLVGLCTLEGELNAIAFEFLTIGDRMHRGGVLVQEASAVADARACNNLTCKFSELCVTNSPITVGSRM